VKADISGGWDVLWDPASEKEGEHGSFNNKHICGIMLNNMQRIGTPAVSAVNGHAVCLHPILELLVCNSCMTGWSRNDGDATAL
jgi:hypothetical protein